MVPVTSRERWTKVARWVVPTYALTAWLFYLQFQNNSTSPMLWGFAIFALGTFFGVRAYGIRERRVFDTIEVRYRHRQRLKRAARPLLLGIAMLAVIWGVQVSSDQFATYWWYAWPALFPLLIGVGLYSMRTERVLSGAGQHARAKVEAAAKQAALEHNTKVEAALGSWPVRYIAAAAVLYGAYYITFEDRSPKTPSWLGLGLLVFAMFLARELGLWLLGIGIVCLIGWGLFAGVAALPVSVAVIIGALIIASAVGKE